MTVFRPLNQEHVELRRIQSAKSCVKIKFDLKLQCFDIKSRSLPRANLVSFELSHAINHVYDMIQKYGLFKQGYIDYSSPKKIGPNEIIISMWLTGSGKKALSALDEGLMWNTKTKNVDIEETKRYYYDLFLSGSGCYHDLAYRMFKKNFKNRRVRNFLLDKLYEFYLRSVVEKDDLTYRVDAFEYYRDKLDRGILSKNDIKKLDTIPNQNIRKKIESELVLFKLSAQLINDAWIIQN